MSASAIIPLMHTLPSLNRSWWVQKGVTLLLAFAVSILVMSVWQLIAGIIGLTQPFVGWDHVKQGIGMSVIFSLPNLLVACFFNFFSKKFRIWGFLGAAGLINCLTAGLWFIASYPMFPLLKRLASVTETVVVFVAAIYLAWIASRQMTQAES